MQSSWKKTYRYGNIGLDIVLSIVVGFLLGRFIDRRLLDGHGYGTIVGTIVGVFIAGRSLYQLSKQAQHEAEAEDARDKTKADKDAKVEAYKREADKDKPGDEKDKPADEKKIEQEDAKTGSEKTGD